MGNLNFLNSICVKCGGQVVNLLSPDEYQSLEEGKVRMKHSYARIKLGGLRKVTRLCRILNAANPLVKNLL